METKFQDSIMNNNVKKVASCTVLQNNEDSSKDENTDNSCRLLSSSTYGNALSSKSENKFTSVDQINKSFKNLKIKSCTEYIEEDEHLAGEIHSIIESLNIILVKPCSSDILLYFGTPLFLNIINFQNYKKEYVLLGHIEDIFGSVGEPMYSVSLKHNPNIILNTNAQVYYFPNNSSTLHMSVEHIIDHTSNKEKYRIQTKKL